MGERSPAARLRGPPDAALTSSGAPFIAVIRLEPSAVGACIRMLVSTPETIAATSALIAASAVAPSQSDRTVSCGPRVSITVGGGTDVTPVIAWGTDASEGTNAGTGGGGGTNVSSGAAPLGSVAESPATFGATKSLTAESPEPPPGGIKPTGGTDGAVRTGLTEMGATTGRGGAESNGLVAGNPARRPG